jgi:hypothetical protein
MATVLGEANPGTNPMKLNKNVSTNKKLKEIMCLHNGETTLLVYCLY